MKKFVFLFCGLLMLGLSSCIKPGKNIQEFKNIPAIVDFPFDLFQYALKTPYGPIYASELQNADDLSEGDALMVSFSVNYDQQNMEKYTMATDLEYIKLGLGNATATVEGESMSDDFNLPIETFGIYNNVEYYFFFGFSHKNLSEGDKLLYEMTYNREKTEETPELIVRAKKSSEGSKYAAYVFNLISFYFDNKDSDNKLKFSIKYKTGVDEEGKDTFEYCTNEYGKIAVYEFQGSE